MSESRAHISVLSVELFLPALQSLKAKRSVLKSIKDRIRSRFNASVAEIGYLDKWQKSVLGICMIGNDRSYLNSCLDGVLALIGSVHNVEILGQQIEFL